MTPAPSRSWKSVPRFERAISRSAVTRASRGTCGARPAWSRPITDTTFSRTPSLTIKASIPRHFIPSGSKPESSGARTSRVATASISICGNPISRRCTKAHSSMSEHDDPHHAAAGRARRTDRSDDRNRDLTGRVAKIESLLIEKGLVDKAALDKLIDIYEHDLGPMNGAKVIARAWVDPAYKRRLLENATAAIAELGFGGLQGEHMVVVENTSRVNYVVVCTVCSCFPCPVI